MLTHAKHQWLRNAERTDTCTNRDQGLRTVVFDRQRPARFEFGGQEMMATDLRQMDAWQWKILFNTVLLHDRTIAA